MTAATRGDRITKVSDIIESEGFMSLRMEHSMPALLLLWSRGYLADKAVSPVATWRKWADDVSEVAFDCGHFIVEEEPELAARAMLDFFAADS